MKKTNIKSIFKKLFIPLLGITTIATSTLVLTSCGGGGGNKPVDPTILKSISFKSTLPNIGEEAWDHPVTLNFLVYLIFTTRDKKTIIPNSSDAFYFHWTLLDMNGAEIDPDLNGISLSPDYSSFITSTHHDYTLYNLSWKLDYINGATKLTATSNQFNILSSNPDHGIYPTVNLTFVDGSHNFDVAQCYQTDDKQYVYYLQNAVDWTKSTVTFSQFTLTDVNHMISVSNGTLESGKLTWTATDKGTDLKITVANPSAFTPSILNVQLTDRSALSWHLAPIGLYNSGFSVDTSKPAKCGEVSFGRNTIADSPDWDYYGNHGYLIFNTPTITGTNYENVGYNFNEVNTNVNHPLHFSVAGTGWGSGLTRISDQYEKDSAFGSFMTFTNKEEVVNHMPNFNWIGYQTEGNVKFVYYYVPYQFNINGALKQIWAPIQFYTY